jgi:hypothetical protein
MEAGIMPDGENCMSYFYINFCLIWVSTVIAFLFYIACFLVFLYRTSLGEKKSFEILKQQKKLVTLTGKTIKDKVIL